MNRHFEDSTYYLGRAAETARAGVAAELRPLRERVESLVGADDPDEDRIDAVRADLEALADRAEGEAREAIEQARARLDAYRERRTERAEA